MSVQIGIGIHLVRKGLIQILLRIIEIENYGVAGFDPAALSEWEADG